MRIRLTSLVVNDQERALRFYTEKLGFQKKFDIPAGEFRWLTVVSPEDPTGTQLVLEPNENPAARQYQKALREQGIPATMFFVEDVHREVERLKSVGVEIRSGPTKVTGSTIAQLDDTCGNLLQIAQLDQPMD